MPVKLGSKLPPESAEARIEIIPLIDIMFFLLAAFMMASLTLIKLQSIKMNLPAATQATRDFKPDIVNIAVDRQGDIHVENRRVSDAELREVLSEKFRANPNVPIYISGDRQATHGDVIRVLDLVRREGIQNVSFAVVPEEAR